MNEWMGRCTIWGWDHTWLWRGHMEETRFSQSIQLTLRKDVDFILLTPRFIHFITIYFLKRTSGQYQNKAHDSVFNYLFQGCTNNANAAWSNLSSEQKRFVCFPWKRWRECMKLILIRVEFQVLSFNRGDKILMPQPSVLSGCWWWEQSPEWCTGRWWGALG